MSHALGHALGYLSTVELNSLTCSALLYKLLGKKEPWKLTSVQELKVTRTCVSSQLLVHLDSKLLLLLACDASDCGIGTVLAHRMPDGSEKPIVYASRTQYSAHSDCTQPHPLTQLKCPGDYE